MPPPKRRHSARLVGRKQISEMHGCERREPPTWLRAGGRSQENERPRPTSQRKRCSHKAVDQGPALSCSWKHRRMWAAWKQKSWRWQKRRRRSTRAIGSKQPPAEGYVKLITGHPETKASPPLAERLCGYLPSAWVHKRNKSQAMSSCRCIHDDLMQVVGGPPGRGGAMRGQ